MSAGDEPRVPALYDVEIGHARRVEPRRSFRHRGYLWLVDLDALPTPPTLPRWLAPFARFRAADHLGDPQLSIRDNLSAWLARQGVDLACGRVLMLTQARVAGYVFNPITLYWCHRPDGDLACVVAEVHNTYHERHCYLLRPDASGHAVVTKKLYVSPFLDQDGEYLMRVPLPGQRLSVSVALRQHENAALVATMRGTRTTATPFALLRLLVTRPLMPQRVALLIRRHGIALWLRRVPIRPRTPHVHQEGIR
jgi:DUF1365 family protein